VDTGPLLLDALLRHRPDVAVVDVRLPPTFTDEGLRAALEARRREPDLGVLVLSQYVEPAYTTELLEAGSGGVGYLLMERVAEVRAFVEAVERVAEGGTVLDREVVSRLVRASEPAGSEGGIGSLTPKEREVLELMAEGRTNAGIAQRLFLTDRTVETHVASIMTKLDLRESATENRRVLAVLTWLGVRPGS
jgi:DNA-binding NarL/FixJ family response regulator